MGSYKSLSKTQAIDRVRELESEFSDFQQQSKELEDFMESELQSTTVKLKRMQSILQKRENETAMLKSKVTDLNRQMQVICDGKSKGPADLTSMSKHVVDLEILNDSLQTNLREKTSQLENEVDKSNSYLERIAMLDNEIGLREEKLKECRLENRDLESKLSGKDDENQQLRHKIEALKQLLEVAVNKSTMHVSKYRTPPVSQK